METTRFGLRFTTYLHTSKPDQFVKELLVKE